MDEEPKSIAEEIWNSIPDENRFTINAEGLGDIVDELETLLPNSETVLGLRVEKGAVIGSIPGIASLINLQCLDLSGCESIQHLPEVAELTSLKSLHLGWCRSLQSLPDIANLAKLQILDLMGCRTLESLPDLANLSNLQQLDLRWCESLQSLPAFAPLKNLRSLKVAGCEALESLPEIAPLRKLESLFVAGCEDPEILPELRALTNLQRLALHGWESVQSLPELAALTKLQSLELWGCVSLQGLPELAVLKNLQSLNLSECESLQSIPDLAALTSLECLDLTDCKLLQSLPELTALTKLDFLDLSGCESLKSIPQLDTLTNLQSLYLNGCSSLERLPEFTALSKLRRLNLSGCKSLQALPNLRGLTNLKSLDLRSCEALQSIPADTLPPSLKELDLSKSKQLREIPALASLTELEELHLTQCPALEGLPDLSKLTRLRVLRLGKAESLTHLPSLATQKELVQLEVWGCRNLRELPDLSHLTRLEELSLAGCHSLQTLPDLSALTRLRKLDLEDCPLLRNAEIAATTRLLEFSHEDPEFVAWVLAQTRARVSGEWFFKDFIDWCTLIPRAKDPGELLRVVAEGFQKCRGPEAPDTALPNLTTAVLQTEAGKLNVPAWRALFGCFDPSAPDERAKLDVLLAQLPPDRLLLEALGPCLDWLGQSATAEHAWALAFTEGLLAAHAPAVLRPLAPNVCLFFHRLGAEDRFCHWLHAFTDPAEPETLDPVHAALARDALAHGDLPAAQAQLARIHRPELRDPVLADLARALAATQPLEAGAALDALFSAARQAGLAHDLLAQPAFTAEPANLYRLLLHLEDDPAALAKLIETTLTHTGRPEMAESVRAALGSHPRQDLQTVAAELTRLAGPTQGTHLPCLAAAFLNRHAVTEVTKPRQLAEFRNRLETHPELLEQALYLGLIQLLKTEGLIDEAEAALLRTEG